MSPAPLWNLTVCRYELRKDSGEAEGFLQEGDLEWTWKDADDGLFIEHSLRGRHRAKQMYPFMTTMR